MAVRQFELSSDCTVACFSPSVTLAFVRRVVIVVKTSSCRLVAMIKDLIVLLCLTDYEICTIAASRGVEPKEDEDRGHHTTHLLLLPYCTEVDDPSLHTTPIEGSTALYEIWRLLKYVCTGKMPTSTVQYYEARAEVTVSEWFHRYSSSTYYNMLLVPVVFQ